MLSESKARGRHEINCRGTKVLPNQDAYVKSRVCSRRRALNVHLDEQVGSGVGLNGALILNKIGHRSSLWSINNHIPSWLVLVLSLAAQRTSRARTRTSTCRGNTVGEASLYTCLFVFTTCAVGLIHLCVSTSHQKVVLELDFSGRLWVRPYPKFAILQHSHLHSIGLHRNDSSS